MITPTYDPDISLSENLDANGIWFSLISYPPGVLASLGSGDIEIMSNDQCADRLKGHVRAFELRGVE